MKDSPKTNGVPAVDCTDLFGVFVNAELKDGENHESRQGWVHCLDPLIIMGASGEKYYCQGEPVRVQNPPICPRCKGRGNLYLSDVFVSRKVECPICLKNDRSLSKIEKGA